MPSSDENEEKLSTSTDPTGVRWAVASPTSPAPPQQSRVLWLEFQNPQSGNEGIKRIE